MFDELNNKNIDIQSILIDSGETLHNIKSKLQNELLSQTLRSAQKNVPYYNALFNKLELDYSNTLENDFLSNLTKIPILTKDMIKSDVQAFINPNVTIIGARFTSGTIDKMCIYVSKEELKAISDWENLQYKTVNQDINLKRPIILRLIFRRLSISPNPPVPVIIIPYFADDVQRTALIMLELTRKHFIPNTSSERVSMIALPTPWTIRLVTKELLSKNFDIKSLGIKVITSAGGHASQSLRQLAKDVWNAEFYGSFNMAEVSGLATECRYHNGYHFDIKMVPLIVDPFSKEFLSFGEEGILLLTTLYPFQQAMPLINYWTGDLVELVNEQCSCGYNGITIKRFIGRREYCLYMGDILPKQIKKKWFSYIDIIEIVDQIPELVYDRPRFRYILDEKNGQKIIKITIEPICEINSTRKDEIKNFLINEIKNRYSEWQNLFRTNELSLDVDFTSYYHKISIEGYFDI